MKKIMLSVFLILSCTSIFSLETFRVNFNSLDEYSEISIPVNTDLLIFDIGVTSQDPGILPWGGLTFTTDNSLANQISDGTPYDSISYFDGGDVYPPSPYGYTTLIVEDRGSGYHLLYCVTNNPNESTVKLTYQKDDFYVVSFPFYNVWNNQLNKDCKISELNGIYTAILYIDINEDGIANKGEYKIIKFRAGKSIKAKSVGYTSEMVLVKAGSFTMGSNTGDSTEKPEHSVTISEDYYIGKYEVTQKLYKDLMKKNPSRHRGDNLPVQYVTWYDAIEFCNALSKKEGLIPYYEIDKINKDYINTLEYDDLKWSVKYNKDANGYRLPTEAQWEFAARGGIKSKNYRYSGSNSLDEVAWTRLNSGDKRLTEDASYNDFTENNCQSRKVGTKKPNELGIYDMSGNASEWCNDFYRDYTTKSLIDPHTTANIDSQNHGRRVLRGGSWYRAANYSTVVSREYDLPTFSFYSYGLRVSRPAR